MTRMQIVWRWKAAHKPQGEPMRWHFAAHGARYRKAEADEMAALLRSHGKLVRFLNVPESEA